MRSYPRGTQRPIFNVQYPIFSAEEWTDGFVRRARGACRRFGLFVAGLGEAGHGNNSPGPSGAGYNKSGNALARRGEPGPWEPRARRPQDVQAEDFWPLPIRAFRVFRG